MNSDGGYDPEPFVDSQLEPPDQSFQTRKGRISRRNAEAEETFTSLVIYAIGPNFHFIFSTLGRAGRSEARSAGKSEVLLLLLLLFAPVCKTRALLPETRMQ
jgi:hypothetical protein